MVRPRQARRDQRVPAFYCAVGQSFKARASLRRSGRSLNTRPPRGVLFPNATERRASR
jgi:hypothetical protein